MSNAALAPIDMNKLPKHIAVIMDGNGRWAKKNKVKIALGHRAGTENLREIIRSSSDLGIEALSIFAFSTENWSRPKVEVDALMQLILEFFSSEIDELCEKKVRITMLGDITQLPERQLLALREAEDRTRENGGLRLNIAINYGARAEMVRMVKQIAEKVQAGEISLDSITEDTLSSHLYTAGLPQIDLLIRTSGELRLSNFLLYQCAYAEFVFPPMLWPDYSLKDYHESICEFQKRKRRFGSREE
ncbi:MAG: isoprenyl transferase [Clostridiales bacterium]|nr:isoprenyl transferase [Clostridiales bacterium]